VSRRRNSQRCASAVRARLSPERNLTVNVLTDAPVKLKKLTGRHKGFATRSPTASKRDTAGTRPSVSVASAYPLTAKCTRPGHRLLRSVSTFARAPPGVRRTKVAWIRDPCARNSQSGGASQPESA